MLSHLSQTNLPLYLIIFLTYAIPAYVIWQSKVQLKKMNQQRFWSDTKELRDRIFSLRLHKVLSYSWILLISSIIIWVVLFGPIRPTK